MLTPTCSKRSPSRSKRVYAPNVSLSSQRASRALTTNQSAMVRKTVPRFAGSAPSAASCAGGNVRTQLFLEGKGHHGQLRSKEVVRAGVAERGPVHGRPGHRHRE